MEPPPLHPAIEQFAADAIAQPEVRAIYVFGSASDGTAVASSDIDLFVVVRDDPADLTPRLRTIADGIDGPPLDLVVVTEGDLLRDGQFRIERAARLVAGDDIRPQLPPMTLDGFIRHYGGAPAAYMSILRPNQPLVPPLDYPDPSGEFYGYDSRTLPPSGLPTHNIKGLVALVCWIATVRLARERGVMASSKAESVTDYASEIADAWTPFIQTIYDLGHDRWHYLVPDDPADRATLRDLCARTLTFENDYVARPLSPRAE